MKKFIKLHAVEFRDPDKVFTIIYFDPNFIFQLQLSDDRIYNEVATNIRTRSPGAFVPLKENFVGGTCVSTTYNNAPYIYCKESPKEIMELIKNLQYE